MAKIRQSNIDKSIITAQTELATAGADDDMLLIYDSSAGSLKKIKRSRVGLLAPTLSAISPTNVLTGDGTGNHTFTVTGTAFDTDVTAKLVKTGGSDLAFSSVTRNSSSQLTCVIAKSSLLTTDEPFDISISSNGFTKVLTNQINVDAQPVFTTSSGSLGTITNPSSGSFQVSATDPESHSTQVTFELQSGSLPPNMTLTNTNADGGSAIISGTPGTVSSNTTYNFVLRAVDAASNTSSRAFSIQVNKQIQYQSFTSSGTFAVPSGTTSLTEVLVVAGGGSGGGFAGYHPDHMGQGSGGGGAGGLIFMPDYPVTPGGTLAITVGCGAQDSILGASPSPGLGQGGVLTAKGGGSGGQQHNIPAYTNGGSGGSGGAGPGSDGSATQPTQPGNSGAYGFGNPGSGQGGGGAGAAGSGQNGGAGRAYTISDGTTSVFYAGGGGGHPGGTGGQGGGGDAGQDGQANKGGGGAGGNGDPTKVGGKGIVIIKY
jgi:mucin-19